jgi:hypothetical protein
MTQKPAPKKSKILLIDYFSPLYQSTHILGLNTKPTNNSKSWKNALLNNLNINLHELGN